MSTADFLVEIGTEELPPTALRSLMEAFGRNLSEGVDDARLEHGDVRVYASPRRLAVSIEALALRQEDRRVEQKGPPVRIAFDDDGKPTPAALAFAKKCGVEVDALDRASSDKGEWLTYEKTEEGQTAAELLPELIERALHGLPIPRRMRWGSGEFEFVRPVQWVVMLHGKAVVDATVFGIASGNETRGHRFHSKGTIKIPEPSKYLDVLEKKGHVIADFERRRALVETGVTKLAEEAGGAIVDGESLYDEVAALVEWPVPILGSFEETYLELPREAVTSTLTGHQRYFPVEDADGNLLPRFVTVSNIESLSPDEVRDGNERVIRPRLADAAFFWDSDRSKTLASRTDSLREVVYQRGLGSLHDKSSRVAALAVNIAESLGITTEPVQRAAMLAKCDLLTGMVGEFPDLQGTMGSYYAAADGEPEIVVMAIGEHYQPRFHGDELPDTSVGRVLAIADKLDTLAGIFAIGKQPSGNRDPFGLRRAALGVIRILVECELDIDLHLAIANAAKAQPASKLSAEEIADALIHFITDRLKPFFLDRDDSLDVSTFEAVLARNPASLVDFANRLEAVQAFIALDEAESLAAANKRIANILKKSDHGAGRGVKNKLLTDDAEKALYEVVSKASKTVRPMIDERRYADALHALASLRTPVDKFFDDVLVMAEDEALKRNRLALLGELRDLFLDVADISRLSID
ncbi:MAG: glycine--tRNA ligase subunit beta [Woeseiaceae bacterium]|nr:glycine--tRNA ligase subunit beta [Woeseiaceae bacterium]